MSPDEAEASGDDRTCLPWRRQGYTNGGRVFERFDSQAMSVVSLARAEARHLGHPAIGTEHLFLALLDEHLAQAGGILRSALPPEKEIRKLIAALPPTRLGTLLDGQFFTEPALSAIARSQDLADSLGQERVSASDIAAALLEDPEVLGVLAELGVNPQAVRLAVADSGPDASPEGNSVSW